MFKKYLTWYHPSFQLVTLLGVVLCGMVAYTLLGYVVSPAIAGMSLQDFQASHDYSSPQYKKTLIAVQLLGSLLAFLAPALLYAYFAYPSPKTYLRAKAPAKSTHWIVGPLIVLSAAAWVSISAYYNQKISFGSYFNGTEDSIAQIEKALLDFKGIDQLLLTIFYIAFVPALAEEFLFRACLQNILMQWTKKERVWLAIGISGFLFGIMHMQMQTALPRIILGILLGYIYLYSGSIWVSVLAHFLNNALAVVFSFLYNNKMMANDLSKNELPPIWFTILSSIVLVALFYYLYKSKSNYEVVKFNHDDDTELFLKG